MLGNEEDFRLPEELNLALDSVIGRGTSSVVYKARRNEDEKKLFAVKVEKKEKNRNLRRRFIKEAVALGRLNNKGLIKVHAVRELDKRSFLVMDFFNGESLDKKISKEGMSEDTTLKMMRTIVSALEQAHKIGVVHRDVKPENILINDEGEKLIDFGFALDVQDKEENVAIGTFLYSSPEQLGVLDQPVDQRSDLYSLGIVLYQCLTGQLPFYSSDVGELAHMHLKQVAPDIQEIQSNVSKVLSLIVKKLLMKDPEDRYQSAKGLLQDLVNIELLKKKEGLSEKDLDLVGSFSGRKNTGVFCGREEELSKLEEAWDAVDKKELSKGNTVCLMGPPGMGKSHLIKQFVGSLQKKELYGSIPVLSIKAQEEVILPFSVIRQIIDEYLKHEIDSGQDRDDLREKLKQMIGEYRHILYNVTPLLKRVLGEDLVDEYQETSSEVYQNILSDFLIRIILEIGRSIIIIDDIQWIDDGSQEVMKKVFFRLKNKDVLFLVTGRNDVDSKIKTDKFVGNLVDIKCLYSNLDLLPLDSDDIFSILKRYLNTDKIDNELTELLFAKSGGNPFICLEYLRALLDVGGLLPEWGKWVVNNEMGEELLLCKDVLQIVLSRINNLSTDTKKALEVAAVVGFKFDESIVKIVLAESSFSVNKFLSESIENGLVECLEGEKFQFSHDRIREALVSNIEENRLKHMHSQVANYYEAELNNLEGVGSEKDKAVYSLATHYYYSDLDTYYKKAFKFCTENTHILLNNYATEEAFDFMYKSSQIAKKYNLEISADLNQLFGQICMLTFRLNDARKYFDEAIKRSKNSIFKAETMGLKAQSIFSGWKIQEAWDEINLALEEINHKLPKSILGRVITTFGYELGRMLPQKFLGLFKKKNDNKVLVKLLNIASEISVFKHPMLLAVPAVRAMFYSSSMLGGAIRARSISTYAMCLGTLKMLQRSEWYFRKAEKIGMNLSNKTQIAENYYFKGFAAVVVGDVSRFVKEFSIAVKEYPEWVTPRQHFDELFSLGWVYSICGDTDKGIEVCENLILRAKSVKNSSSVYEHYSPAYYGVMLVMIGEVKQGGEYTENLLEALKNIDPNPVLGGDVNASLIGIYYETKDYGDNMEQAFARVKQLAPNPMFSFFALKNAYISKCYIRLDQFFLNHFRGDKENESKYFSLLGDALKELKQATQGAEFYQAHVLSITAAEQYILGKDQKALNIYSQAVEFAGKTNSLIGKFEALRGKGRVLKKLNKTVESEQCIAEAMSIAIEKKWTHRVGWIENEFNITSKTKINKNNVISSSSEILNKTEVLGRSELDIKRYLNSLLEVSLAASEVLDPDEQVIVALDQINKVMGAERSFVFLLNEDKNEMEFIVGRDDKQQSLEKLEGHSSTIVKEVQLKKEAMIITGTDEGEALGSESAVAHGLRSIMAAPIILKDKFKGVVYSDSTLAKGIFTQSDKEILSSIASHIGIMFNTAKLSRLEVEKKTLEKDLELSGAVQNLLLPNNMSVEKKRYSLAGFYRPATQCSGDWLWYEEVADDRVIFFLGDVTGHGAGPAMITATVASHFRAEVKGVDSYAKAKELFSSSDRHLRKIAQGNYLMTAALGFIDLESMTLNYIMAGAPMAYKFSRDNMPDFLTGISGAMGNKKPEVIDVQVKLESGDRLFICTDGIIELELANSRMLGEKRLAKLISETRDMSGKETVNYITEKLDEMRGDVVQEDDLTFLVFDVF